MGRSRLPRALATAAVLLAAAVIAATQYVHPTLPAAAVTPDDPPTGVALIYLLGAQPHTLVAYDWTGRRRGSITVPSWVLRQDVRMAPDGGAFFMVPTGTSDAAAYFDRLGRVVLQTNNESFSPKVWSDDFRHLCLYDGLTIVVRLPGEQDRTLTAAADNVVGGDIAIDACSVRNDLVVMSSRTGVFEAGPPTTTVATVRMSTGAVLSSQKWVAVNVVSSVDAAYVAVTAQDGAEPTTIYRTTDLNTAAGALDPQQKPLIFSGDGTELLVAVPTGTGQLVEAMDWRKHRVAWRFDEAGTGIGPIIARPKSNEFALQIVDPTGAPQGVVIAHADGSTTRLPYGDPVMVNN